MYDYSLVSPDLGSYLTMLPFCVSQLFKKLFQDSLEIQKERLHELRKYAREHRDSEARVQRDQIESMEN